MVVIFALWARGDGGTDQHLLLLRTPLSEGVGGDGRTEGTVQRMEEESRELALLRPEREGCAVACGEARPCNPGEGALLPLPSPASNPSAPLFCLSV